MKRYTAAEIDAALVKCGTMPTKSPATLGMLIGTLARQLAKIVCGIGAALLTIGLSAAVFAFLAITARLSALVMLSMLHGALNL